VVRGFWSFANLVALVMLYIVESIFYRVRTRRSPLDRGTFFSCPVLRLMIGVGVVLCVTCPPFLAVELVLDFVGGFWRSDENT
jgi:hypothetical protein